jgi:hypothetical protein
VAGILGYSNLDFADSVEEELSPAFVAAGSGFVDLTGQFGLAERMLRAVIVRVAELLEPGFAGLMFADLRAGSENPELELDFDFEYLYSDLYCHPQTLCCSANYWLLSWLSQRSFSCCYQKKSG